MSLHEIHSELFSYQTKLDSSKNSTLLALDSMLKDVVEKSETLPINSDKSKANMRKHLKSASQQHKNLHGSVSKIGKAIDKLEVEECQLDKVLPFQKTDDYLENGIYVHLRLNEQVDIGQVLLDEYMKNGDKNDLIEIYDDDTIKKWLLYEIFM